MKQIGTRAARIGTECLWFGLPLAAILLICLRFDFGAPITDLFHEGEYLSSGVSVAHAERYGFPILVHGLLNYLPFEWATAACGANRSFACTRAINAFLVMLAMVGFLTCVRALTRERRDLRLAGLIGTIVLFIVVNGRTPNMVYLHQGAPGIRDLFLFIELLLLIMASFSARRAIMLAALVGAGLMAAAGLFWAYNRGLIGIGLLGTYTVVRAIGRRDLVGPLAASGGLAAGLVALYLADPAAFVAHPQNILYWATHGSLWQIHGSLVGSTIFYGLGLSLVGWVALLLFRERRPVAEREIGAVLLVQMLAFLQVAYGRPDGVHFAFGLPAMLLLGLFALRLQAPTWLASPDGPKLALTAVLLLALMDMNTPAPTLQSSIKQAGWNLKRLITGMPHNQDLFGPRERLAAQVLAQAGPCTYALEGSGVLYALSGRPPCSPFLYPSYVGPEGEAKLIADLARARPNALVVESRHWSMFLDERTPAQRVPQLVAWIDRRYPHIYRVGDFVIRTNQPVSIAPTALRSANTDTDVHGAYDPQAPALK